MNRGAAYPLWDYEAQQEDELSLQEGEGLLVLRREEGWWWARCGGREGYVARNLLGVGHAHTDTHTQTQTHNHTHAHAYT